MSPESKVAEIRVNKLAANIVGSLLTILLCLAGVFFAQVLPHHTAFSGWHATALLVSFLVLLPVHEGLHAVGLVQFAGVARGQIRFGVMWRALTPYCHCTVPISVRAYRRMALLPLQVTGSVTIIALVLFPTDWLGLLAGMAVAACVGDIWLVAKLKRFGDDCFVQDSPSEIGCDVYSGFQQSAS